jgi:hypothetical protein
MTLCVRAHLLLLLLLLLLLQIGNALADLWAVAKRYGITPLKCAQQALVVAARALGWTALCLCVSVLRIAPARPAGRPGESVPFTACATMPPCADCC